MIYDFGRVLGNLYAIEADGKIYGLKLEIAIVHLEEGKALSYVYLLDENEKVICKVPKPFASLVKFSREGFDIVENMLDELAEEAKKMINVDLFDTFREIRKDIKGHQITRT